MAGLQPGRPNAGFGAGGVVRRRFARDPDGADPYLPIGAEDRNAAGDGHHMWGMAEAGRLSRRLLHLGG